MVKQENNLTPSIFSAIQKLRELLTREEKIKWLGIVGFALVVSLLEVVTASVIVVFAQVLNDPSVGQKYFQKLGITENLSPGKTVFYVAIAVGVVYVVKNLIAAAEVFFQNFSIQKMCFEFKNKLLHRYAQADYGFYLTRNSSFGLQVVGSDVEQAFSSGMVSLARSLSEGSVFIFLVGMIVYVNPTLVLIIFVIGMTLGLLTSKFLLPKFYYWGQNLQQTGFHTHKNLMQFFHSFKEIVLLGKKESFVKAYQVHSKERSKVQAIQTATNALPRMGIEILFVGLFVLTISYLCMGHESPMQMIGLLSGYLYAGFRLMPGLNRIINDLNALKSVIPSIDRVHQEYIAFESKSNYVDETSFRFTKSIEFNNVNFKYLNSKKNTLSNINLKINKGESVGIVGHTGSGKSTLIDLILGLLRPEKGNVLIDAQYKPNSFQWHKKIGYVAQSINLIDDTVEANIAFGCDKIDKEALDNAVDSAQLRQFVNSLPNGLKTTIGERGIRVSGGERQRISIARALYRNPEVLIFDEATSALDSATEKQLMETIDTICDAHTVIMIAHRVSTLKNCDRIFKIENGKLSEVRKDSVLAMSHHIGN
ncbi:MAG: ABC transporter ATP-binding protein [Alphaproteobacteria bacterium]|nr:MAG: ABC transporter ATP-binding protein [Alphaproteobacteria bacterium]